MRRDTGWDIRSSVGNRADAVPLRHGGLRLGRRQLRGGVLALPGAGASNDVPEHGVHDVRGGVR